MKQNLLLSFIIVLLFYSTNVFCQHLTLDIISDIEAENLILKKIDFKKKHSNDTSLFLEIEKISNNLKNIGYFTNTNDSIKRNKLHYLAYYSLGKKIEKAEINTISISKKLLKNLNITNNTISLPIKELKNKLSGISKLLDLNGQSFSKVSLKNISIKNKTLFANLNINQSKKRIINKVIVKGYKDFPKSYLKNYFNLKSNIIFTQQKINEVSKLSKNLEFVTEIKPPEVLFTKDSTLMYIFLKKRKHHSFDGIVNFASKENGKVMFIGNVDLQLNNIFNQAEKLALFWNSIGEEKQEFKLSTETPYIFNTRVTPQISFLIYKQDSTFLNTKFDSKIHYQINPKLKLGLTINSETSEKLTSNTNNTIDSFKNYFIGFQITYKKNKNDVFNNKKIYFELNPSFGKRNIKPNNSNQFKINFSASYLYELDNRNSIYIKNNTGYINSDMYIDNELYRIGGASSIRGFNEQNIFTNSFTYFNTEYQFLTSQKSYLYSITDFGNFEYQNKKNALLSLGLGYLFINKNSKININTSVGRINNNKFNFNNVKLVIGWVNYF